MEHLNFEEEEKGFRLEKTSTLFITGPGENYWFHRLIKSFNLPLKSETVRPQAAQAYSLC